MPVRSILSSVWVRLSIFIPLSIIQYVGLYVFSLPITLVMIERIYILCLIIIIKSEVWTITHCLGLGHETMVSAVCLSIFLIKLQLYIHVSNVFFSSCKGNIYQQVHTSHIAKRYCQPLDQLPWNLHDQFKIGTLWLTINDHFISFSFC